MKSFIAHMLLAAIVLIGEVRADSCTPAMANIDLQLGVVQKEINDAQQVDKKLKSDLKWARAGHIALEVVQDVAAVAGAIFGLGDIESWIKGSALPVVQGLLKNTGGGTGEAMLDLVINGEKVHARDAADARVWVETALDRLEHTSPIEEQEVDELFTALGQWYQAASVNPPKEKENQLSDVQLPFVENTLRLLKLKFGYFSKLAEKLRAQTAACHA